MVPYSPTTRFSYFVPIDVEFRSGCSGSITRSGIIEIIQENVWARQHFFSGHAMLTDREAL